MREESTYLEDILDAISAVRRFVEGMDFEDFKNDDKTFSAVLRKLEVIGEATKNISEETKNSSP
ncbi:MAG: DUF86 domain-containing protein [Saprospiraceae bacterium]|nr:DUF86 domain-containing protein [Saprospiraceae bacterium]